MLYPQVEALVCHVCFENTFHETALKLTPYWIAETNFPLYVSHRKHFLFQSRLHSGILNVKKVLKHNVKVGLGTGW